MNENIIKAMERIQNLAEEQRNALVRFYEVFGDDFDYSYISVGDKVIHLHPDDYKSALTMLLPYAQKPMNRSIFPHGKANAASIAFGINWTTGWEVVVHASVDDYTEFLKPGATCRRVPMAEKLECD